MKKIKTYYGYIIALFLFVFAIFTILFAFSTTNTYALSTSENSIDWDWQELSDYQVQVKFVNSGSNDNSKLYIDEWDGGWNEWEFGMPDIYLDSLSLITNGITIDSLIINRYFAYEGTTAKYIKFYYNSVISPNTNAYLCYSLYDANYNILNTWYVKKIVFNRYEHIQTQVKFNIIKNIETTQNLPYTQIDIVQEDLGSPTLFESRISDSSVDSQRIINSNRYIYNTLGKAKSNYRKLKFEFSNNSWIIPYDVELLNTFTVDNMWEFSSFTNLSIKTSTFKNTQDVLFDLFNDDWVSETNYQNTINDLQVQLDKLQNEYNDLQKALNDLTNNVNPFEENISQQKLYINDILYTPYSDYDYVFTTNKRNLVIDSSGIRDIYNGILNNQEGNIRYELTLNQPVSTFNITMQTYLPFDMNINMYNNTNQNVLSYNLNSMGGTNGDGYYEYGEILNVKKIIIEMDVNQDTSSRNNSYISFGSSYADGYNDGINQNNTYWHNEYIKLGQEIESLNQQIISLNESLDLVYGQRDLLQNQNANLIEVNNQYSTQVNELNTQITTLQSNINTLQIAYNDLNESYTNMLSGNNFANLFFVIAETPFTSFKQIWNVDFLGVNLAGFVTGILFLGLIIWVIKKIF